VVFVIAAALAGCAVGDEDATVQLEELRRIVLQRADLPSAYRLTASGGLESSGWFARYWAKDALEIESRVVLFSSADGAADGLQRERELLREAPREWQPIDEPGLGDESFAATLVLSGVRYYRVAWRDANAAASLWVSGRETGLPLAEVLALARAQGERIDDAKS
jgi:hypothetical protein